MRNQFYAEALEHSGSLLVMLWCFLFLLDVAFDVMGV